MITTTTLASIKVLFRSPDALALWGIPYEMRPGQAPRDLWNGRRVEDFAAKMRGVLGATIVQPGPREDWIWLGTPGWWGGLGAAEIALVREYVEAQRRADTLPGHPFEWCEATPVTLQEVT